MRSHFIVSYTWRPKGYHLISMLYHLSIFHCGVRTTKTGNTWWLQMQRSVPMSRQEGGGKAVDLKALNVYQTRAWVTWTNQGNRLGGPSPAHEERREFSSLPHGAEMCRRLWFPKGHLDNSRTCEYETAGAVFHTVRSRIGTKILSVILIHRTVFLSINPLCCSDALYSEESRGAVRHKIVIQSGVEMLRFLRVSGFCRVLQGLGTQALWASWTLGLCDLEGGWKSN